MTTSQLHDPQCSYSQHLFSKIQRQTSQVYIVKEAPYPELSMLEGHQPWNMTSCIQHLPPTFHSLQMYEEYILTTTRFPLVYYNNPYYNFFLFHTPGKQDHLTISIHFQLDYLNRIHTEEVDLLKFKRNNDIPPWYHVFQIPY